MRRILHALVLLGVLALSLNAGTPAFADPAPAAPATAPAAVSGNTRPSAAPALPAAISASGTVSYTLTDLGPGQAHDINASGQVVGAVFDSSGGPSAAVWDPGATAPRILGPGEAYGINSAGDVVGYSHEPGHDIPALWRAGSSGVQLLSAATEYGEAFGINDSGQVVGEVIPHAFIYDGSLVILQSSAQTSAAGAAFGISSSGAIVGYDRQQVGDQVSDYQAVSWQGGVPHLLPSPSPVLGNAGYAFEVNDAGKIVGSVPHGDFVHAPTLWDGGGYHDLGLPAGGGEGSASGINNRDQIVGEYDAGGGVVHGVLWQKGTVTDLSAFVPASVTFYANDLFSIKINDNGQIAFTGLVGGEPHAMVLTPHQPTVVVFVPGMAGSVLVDANAGNKELWPAPLSDHSALSLFPQDNPSSGVIATDALPAVTPLYPIYGPLLSFLGSHGFPEYQVNGDPNRRTTSGCDLSQAANDPRLFVFAYDWRRSSVEAAAQLADYVGCVRKFYPNDKLILVAHSNGGLVSRRYILDHPANHGVDTLITIGTPFLGVAKFPYILETGDFVPFITDATTRHIVASFHGAHQLAPAEAYFDVGAPAPLGDAGRDVDGDGNRNGVYDYPTYKAVVDRLYGQNGLQPATTAQAFHAGSQDDWRTDASGVTYHHIYGVQAANRTIGTTLYTTGLRCLILACVWVDTVTLQFTQGDGTVPVESASRRGSGGDYNAPGATLWRMPGTGDDDLVEHNGLNSNPDVQQLILDLLQGNPSATATPSGAAPAGPFRVGGAPAQTAAALAAAAPAYYLRVGGGTAFSLSDTQGNTTGPLDGGPSLRGKVPGADTFILGADSYLAILDPATAYAATFTGSGGPVEVDLTLGTGDTSTHTLRYRDIALPAGAHARLALSGAGSIELAYDGDGNGSFETVVPPSLDLSGAAASDLQPPLLSGQVTPAGGMLGLSLQASDAASAIARVAYSLDGSHYQPYTGPFQVPAGAASNLYAFADDAAGNRGTLVLALPTATPPIVTAQPANQTVNAGGTASFTAAASGSPAPTVQWQVSIDGGATFANIAGATSASYSFAAQLAAGGNQYRAVFTNPAGTATTNAATLTVNAVPVITLAPVSQTVNPGGTATFVAAASGSPAPTVQWQVSTNNGASFSNIAGATTGTYAFVAQAADSGRQYRAVFTNGLGSATTSAAALTVASGGAYAAGAGFVNDSSGVAGLFAFSARNVTGQAQGQLAYLYRGRYAGRAALFVIRSNAVTALSMSGVTYPVGATLAGPATIRVVRADNGAVLFTDSHATFRATAVDAGTAFGFGKDKYGLTVVGGNGQPYKTVPASLLQFGNVTVRSK